jgi:translocation and assembly module TamB
VTQHYAPLRRRRRWPYFLVAFFVVLIALIWFAPVIVANTSLKHQLLRSVTSEIKGTVTVQSMSLGWMSPIEMRGVMLVDEAGVEVIHMERVFSEKTLASLVGNKHDFGRFTLESPTATIVCHERETNLELVLANYLTSEVPKSASRSRMTVAWSNGTATIRDAVSNRIQTLTNLVGEASIPASTTDAISLQATGSITESSGRVELNGMFGANGSILAKLEHVPLDGIGWFARRYEPGLSVDGIANGSANVEWTAEGGKGEGHLVGLSVSVGSTRLGTDRISSKTVDIPLKFQLSGKQLTLEQFTATTDVGRASLIGTIDLAEPVERWLLRPGLKANAKIDLAKLGMMIPNALHVHEGTTITDGTIQLDIASETTATGPLWQGFVTASTIRAVRNGRTIVWDQPVRCEFAGRLNAESEPHFDKLQIASDFIGLNFRGSLDSFEAAATLNLDQLSAHLNDFVNLNGIRLAGGARVQAWNRPGPNDVMAFAFKANVERFLLRDDSRREWSEPAMTIDATADAKREGKKAIRIERATAKLTAVNDSARFELTEPIPNMYQVNAGKAKIDLSGDLGRWRTRLASVLGIPRDWNIAGAGRLSSVLSFTDMGITAERNDGELTNLRFRGWGLQIDDPRLKVNANTVQWDHKTGELLGTIVALTGESIAADCERLSIRDFDRTIPSLDGTVVIRAVRLSKVANTFGLATDPQGRDAVDGIAKGTIQCKAANGDFGIDAKLTVDSFRYGPPQKPLWTEPKVELAASGRYTASRDSLDLTSSRIAMTGFQIAGNGSIGQISGFGVIDLKGTIEYDLAKVEPYIKDFLGRNGSLAGKDSRPFRVEGRLGRGTGEVAVIWGGLNGDASVGWKSARAYGFDVGPADLKANLAKGTIAFQPVSTTLGSGRLSVHPALAIHSPDLELTFAKGRIVEKARLTPAVCADALGFALPAIARSTEAEGLISIDLESSRIPLVDYTRMTAKGQLVMHTVTLVPGPIIREILTATGTQEPRFTLAKEQSVPVWIENGRVHHRDFTLTAKSFSIRTSGSVGFDGSLQLTCEVPIPEKLLDQAFRNTPRIREALAKRTIAIAIGGTIDRPKLDARAFQANVQKLIGEATKDAASELLKQQLKKGLEQFLPKPPPKKP